MSGIKLRGKMCKLLFFVNKSECGLFATCIIILIYAICSMNNFH